MDWQPWQQEIKNCKIIVYYDQNHQLYPLSDWLHPGLIPIGDGNFDELYQDLPNLEWFLRHLGWLGFYQIDILTSEKLRGLDLISEMVTKPMKLSFEKGNLIEKIIQSKDFAEYIIIAPGLNLTNSDLRSVLLLHQQKNNIATILSVRGLKFQVGLVTYNTNNYLITNFKEKPVDKTQLVNSGILILNVKNQDIQGILLQLDKTTRNQTESIHEFIQLLIANQLLDTIELTGEDEKPWFLDLSKIESWIKLDPHHFIENFSHLFQRKKT